MPRKIAIVVHALHGGGAERVAATMANQWSSRGDQIVVITLDTVDSDVFSVDSTVKRIGLDAMRDSKNAWQAVTNNVRRIRALRTAIRHAGADCVVSVTDQMNVLTILACLRTTTPVVIAEHSDPRCQRMSRCWEQLRNWTYPRCAAAVVLTQTVAEHLRPILGNRPVFVIPNSVQRPEPAPCDTAQPTGNSIVAMGRLSHEKGFDLLIDAFAQLAPRNRDWELIIAGVGPEQTALEQQIRQRDLSDRVHLSGWVDQPHPWLRQASLFVLSSRYEGFPVALLEAMACGLPVVSFDCESGPREIIRHGTDGLLVPPEDVSALAAAIERVMLDVPLRKALADNARQVVDRFSEQRYLQRWDDVFSTSLDVS